MSDGYKEQCCAHLVVQYKPLGQNDGTLAPQWLCRDCGHQFLPAGFGLRGIEAGRWIDAGQLFWDKVAAIALPELIRHAPNGGSEEVYKAIVQAADTATSLLRKRGIEARRRLFASEQMQNLDWPDDATGQNG